MTAFDAYPNPTTDQLIVITEKTTSFSLLDMTGKTLKSFEVKQQKAISITGLAAGVYLLRENTTGSQTKIVKQ